MNIKQNLHLNFYWETVHLNVRHMKTKNCSIYCSGKGNSS